tara:strand:+ start:1360 stop:1692 length:333 start_codon:yes stop_codon:yes gene_type:complete
MKRHLTLLLLLAALTPALICALAPARADDDDDHRDRKRLDAAVERGEVLPLSEILARVKPGIEGRIVEIEFEYSHGAPIYEIYVLSRDGRRHEYEIDARTATILSFEDDD